MCLGRTALAQTWADDPPERRASWTARGDEIVRLVREHFFDRKVAEDWATRFAGYSRAADSDEKFVDVTRWVLGELKASHTGFFTTRDAKYYGLRAIFASALKVTTVEWDSPGADFTAEHFVRVVFAGGPAAKAGLRRGDKILQADGKVFHPVDSFRGRSGKPVILTVQRKADGLPIAIQITPRRIDPKREWLVAEENGAKLIARRGKRAAYVPLFSCAGDEYERALRELLSTRLRDADALILDVRDGFGGCNPQMVNVFNRAPAVLTYIDRKGQRRPFDPQWRKPLVVLINGGSSSGKEVFAHSIKVHGLGTLVGQRTAGAVLAGRCFLLCDGSVLYLAVSDLEVDGQRLEGRGIDPDIEVADALEFADGVDPQLDAAIDVATR
jgi:carboxyl-terminal processing protease